MMESLYYFVQDIGIESLSIFWFPILIWTVASLVVFIVLRMNSTLNPLYQYHLRVATLFALPIGLLASYVLKVIPQVFKAADGFNPSLIVIQNPILVEHNSNLISTLAESGLNWLEPTFLLGVALFAFFAIACILFIRLIWSFTELRKLHNSLQTDPISEYYDQLKHTDISIGFFNHPMVPFTYGWKKPVIVLPAHFIHDKSSMDMAVQHELVHIDRGDYLLQLGLSVIKSMFWFHPLVHMETREIELYREVSCDQAVLSTHDISPKNYASMLYQLAPLSGGVRKLAVNMAIPSSTLKRRINQMAINKNYSNSLKKSTILLLLLLTGITLPIACTGLADEQSTTAVVPSTGTISSSEPDKEVFTIVEEQPVIIGGLNALQQSIKYPDRAKQAGIEGQVIVQLIVDKEGGIRKPKVVQGVGGGLDEEALRVIEQARFTPGKQKGRPVDVVVSIPVIFKLTNTPRPIEAKITTNKSAASHNGDVFVVVQKQPELIGGLKGLQSKLEYPDLAKRAGIQGRVIIQFIVNEKGEVENPIVTRSLGGGCDEAALKALKEHAKFIPGKQQGQDVKVQVSLPFYFKLS